MRRRSSPGIKDQAYMLAVFTTMYHKFLEEHRHMLSTMYMDDATLLWNENCVVGKNNIQKFWIELPSLELTIYTSDVQPNIDEEDQPTLLVKIGGQVGKYNGSSEANQTFFNHTFIITSDEWKIVKDCFRTIEPLEPTEPIELAEPTEPTELTESTTRTV